jgi:hypothetical protein
MASSRSSITLWRLFTHTCEAKSFTGERFGFNNGKESLWLINQDGLTRLTDDQHSLII